MLFNSYEFIFLFLPLTFFIYFFLIEKRLIIAAKGFMVFASLFFYSWWNVSYLPIILSSMLFNYLIGNSLNEKHTKITIHKKSLLVFGITANLSLLGYFKYSDFFLENFNLAFSTSIPLPQLVLPLAISFFTFQQIAYLVDSYRKETIEYDFLNYALFVTFFPQLIAGPIVHHAEMMPQFASKWNMVKKYKNIGLGLLLFSIGLFKKIVIADTFSQWATHGFDNTTILSFYESWLTSLSYTFQIYFDFSGYTDMAIGAALLFNIRLPINFNSPYKALDIQDFWRRWHITLSRFLRDYVYIPLGGNRAGNYRLYTNIFITFVLGGIWHGAGWTFILWGALHGVALVIHRYWVTLRLEIPKILAWFITFNFVNVTWIFFRAKDMESAFKVLNGMVNIESIDNTIERFSLTNLFVNNTQIAFIIIAFVLVIFFKNTAKILQQGKKLNLMHAVFIALTILYSYLLSIQEVPSEFLYFNF